MRAVVQAAAKTLPRPHAHLGERASVAASRRPARAIASGGEGRGARPRAADAQLVGGGEGVCGLPSRKDGVRGIMREGAERGEERGTHRTSRPCW